MTEADYAAHRAGRIAELTAPDGWLTVVGQQLLDEGPNEMEEVGRVILEGGVARVGDLVLRPEELVPFGGRTLQLVSRAGRYALRVRDPDSPRRRELTAIPAFPIDPAWRVPARLVPEAKQVQVVHSSGIIAARSSPGPIEFDGPRGTGRLGTLRFDRGLLIIFGDETNGKETYGAGRYLWIEEPVTVADFNLAENPACVYSEHAACPLPAPEDRLAYRVEAGETYPKP